MKISEFYWLTDVKQHGQEKEIWIFELLCRVDSHCPFILFVWSNAKVHIHRRIMR